MDVGNVRVDDRRVGGVHTDPALHSLGLKAVDPHTVEGEMMRHVGEISLRAVAEPDDVVNQIGGTECGDVDADELVMMSACESVDNGVAGNVGTQSREQTALRRGYASRDFGGSRRLNRDVSVA